MKVSALIKISSLLLLGIWIAIHLPLNLLHWHEPVCDLAGLESSEHTFHFHETTDEFCFFCTSSFAKESVVLPSEIIFAALQFEIRNSNLISTPFLFYKGIVTERAPPSL